MNPHRRDVPHLAGATHETKTPTPMNGETMSDYLDEYVAKINAANESKTYGLSVVRVVKEQDALIKAMDATAAAFRDRAGDYSDEGKTKKYAEYMGRFTARAEHLQAMENDLLGKSLQRVKDARASLFPTSEDANETLAAELAARRIMERGGDDYDKAVSYISLPPSHARTILIEEMQARGQLKDDLLEALLRETSEDYSTALQDHSIVQSAVNSAMLGRKEYIEHRMSNWNENKPQHNATLDVSIFGDAAAREFKADRPIGDAATVDPAFRSYLPNDNNN